MSNESTRSQERKDPAQAAMKVARDKELANSQREALNALIEEQVRNALGAPRGTLDVRVRPLWQGHYRVNVFVGGAGDGTAKVAHSYFVVADGEGNILKSSPAV